MKSLLAILACLISVSCFAQRTVDVDKTDGVPANTFIAVGGEVFTNTKFVRLVEGSPYFKDDWIAGVGITANGERYKAAQLKLDLYDQQVHYLDVAGNEMVAT